MYKFSAYVWHNTTIIVKKDKETGQLKHVNH